MKSKKYNMVWLDKILRYASNNEWNVNIESSHYKDDRLIRIKITNKSGFIVFLPGKQDLILLGTFYYKKGISKAVDMAAKDLCKKIQDYDVEINI